MQKWASSETSQYEIECLGRGRGLTEGEKNSLIKLLL